jgi:peptide/nickel transport system substrate-binding protein
LSAIATVMVSCAAPSAPETVARGPEAQHAAAPKRIVGAIKGDPFTLNSMMSNLGGTGGVRGINEVEQLVSAALAHEDDHGKLRPILAEAVPSLENELWKVAPDGRMETTWTLRPGAVWHDGAPVTTDDLLFAARVGQDRELEIPIDAAYKSIETFEAVDGRTVLVRWRQPYVLADTLFGYDRGLPLPKHILERPYLENKATFPEIPYWTEEFVGTGPFTIRQFVRGSHLVVERNDRYVLGRPGLDEIEVRFIPDNNTLIANLLAGVVDISLGPGISIEQALEVRDQWGDGRVDYVSGTSIRAHPNLHNPNPATLLEPQLRRALIHAIDRQQMIDSLQGGLSRIAHGYISPSHPEFVDTDPRVVKYDYDPRRGAQLVEALGYTKGADGMFRDAAGEPLSIEVRTSPGRAVSEKSTIIVSDYFKAMGVGSDSVVIPQQRSRDREYRANRPGLELGGQPDDLMRLHSSQVPRPDNRYEGDNRIRYTNPEMDGLIDRYFRTIQRSDRVRVMGDILHHVSDRTLITGLFYEAEPTMISNRLQNATAGGVSDPTWNVHEWGVKP